MPYGPVERYIWVNYDLSNEQQAQNLDHPPPSLVASIVGVNKQTVLRWRHTGWIPWRQADRVACQLGLHPAELWDEWTTRLEPALCT